MQPRGAGASTQVASPFEAVVKKARASVRKRPTGLLTVVDAVVRDLDEIAQTDAKLAGSALAASALALAREMDSPNSATSKSMCARALLETLDRLRDLAPTEHEEDAIDELRSRRERRRTGSATT